MTDDIINVNTGVHNIKVFLISKYNNRERGIVIAKEKWAANTF